jgi:hypothetical protein
MSTQAWEQDHEMKEDLTQSGRRARVLDDLKLLIYSLPAAVRLQAIADIKSVVAELSPDRGDQRVSPAVTQRCTLSRLKRNGSDSVRAKMGRWRRSCCYILT